MFYLKKSFYLHYLSRFYSTKTWQSINLSLSLHKYTKIKIKIENFFKLLVAIGDSQGTISVYNQTNTLQESFQAHTSTINRIKFLKNSSGYAATISCDSTSKIWNTMTNPWTLIVSYTYVQATYCYGSGFIVCK